MADDINKKNIPVNKIAEDDFSRILRRTEYVRHTPTVAERRLDYLASRYEKKIEELGKDFDPSVDIHKHLANIEHFSRLLERTKAKIEEEKIARKTRFEKTFTAAIQKHAGHDISEQRIRQYARTTPIFTKAVGIGTRREYTELETERHASEQQIENLRERMYELSQDPYIDRRALLKTQHRLQRAEYRHATIDTALKIRKKEGHDIPTAYMDAGEFISNIETRRERRRIKEDVAEGRLKPDDIIAAVRTTEDEAIQAAKEFTEALKEGKGNLEELSKTYREAAAAHTTAQRTAKAAGVDTEAIGQGGLLDFIGKFIDVKSGAMKLRIAGAGLTAAADITRFEGIRLPAMRTEVHTAMAELENRRAMDYFAALEQGDIASAMRLTEGWDRARLEGRRVHDHEMNATAAEISGRLATGAGNFLQNLARVQPTTAAVGAIEAGAIAYTRARATPERAALEATDRERNLIRSFDAIMAIPAHLRQRVYDHAMGTRGATMGFGMDTMEARIGDFLQLQTGPSGLGLEELTQRGMTIQQAQALSAQAAQTIGPHQWRGTETLMDVARLQQAGIMRGEQAVGLMGQLADVGGDASSRLMDIIAKAIPVGMGNSKNIQQMVSSLEALSRDTATRGIDITAAMTDALSSAFSIYQDLGIPENLRAGTAQRTIGGLTESLTTAQYDLPTLLRWGRNVRTHGMGGDPWEWQAALQLDPRFIPDAFSQLQQIRSNVDLTEDERRQQESALAFQMAGTRVGMRRFVRPDEDTGLYYFDENLMRRSQRDLARATVDTVFHPMSVRPELRRLGYEYAELETHEERERWPNSLDLKQGLDFSAAQLLVGPAALEVGMDLVGGRTTERGVIPTQTDELDENLQIVLQREIIAASTELKTLNDTLREMHVDNLREGIDRLNDTFSGIKEGFDAGDLARAPAEAAEKYSTSAIKISDAANTFEDAVERFEKAIRYLEYEGKKTMPSVIENNLQYGPWF